MARVRKRTAPLFFPDAWDGDAARYVRSEYRVYAGPNPLSRLKTTAADKKSLTRLKAVLRTNELRHLVTPDPDPGRNR